MVSTYDYCLRGTMIYYSHTANHDYNKIEWQIYVCTEMLKNRGTESATTQTNNNSLY